MSRLDKFLTQAKLVANIMIVLDKVGIPANYMFCDTVENAKQGVKDYYNEQLRPFYCDDQEIDDTIAAICNMLDEVTQGNSPALARKEDEQNGLEPTVE